MNDRIHPDVMLGPIHLFVADLTRSVDFYTRSIGLLARHGPGRAGAPDGVARPAAASAVVGTRARDLLVLHERPGARPPAAYSGLFHFALLVPERSALATWLRHAIDARVGLTGASDHFVSEALYLNDPDGHGIEIYADRPREMWEGEVAERMTTLPLDLDDLLDQAESTSGAPPFEMREDTRMGHVHLRVSDVGATVDFYRDVLGFDLMATYGTRAVFFGAGGYHHHIGANTWGSAGRGQAPAAFAALRHLTLELPDTSARDALVERAGHAGHPVTSTAGGLLARDPSGNGILLKARPGA